MWNKIIRNLKTYLIIGVFSILFLGANSVAWADNPIGTVSNPITGSGAVSNKDQAAGFVNKGINFMTAMAAAWLLITIIWNGFTIIKSDKSAEAFSQAMKNIMFSILGMLVVGMAYVLTVMISTAIFGKNMLDTSNW